jgi:hypothetical protein
VHIAQHRHAAEGFDGEACPLYSQQGVSPTVVGSTPSVGDTSLFPNPFLNLYS